MKRIRFFYLILPFVAASMTSCVVPVYPEGRAVSTVGVRYQTYDTLPRGYVGDTYYYGGHYYSGGRYEQGHYYDHGHVYGDRYYHNGQYYYGGHHEHHSDHGSSQHAGYIQVQRTRY